MSNCECENEEHEISCPEHPDYDPTPYCANCGAKSAAYCDCGPLPDND